MSGHPMRVLSLVTIFALTLLAAPLAAEAQPAGKVYRIGYLETGVVRPRPWEAFRERLRELGYVEGQTVAFETRWADGQIDRLPGLAAELVRLKVDVVVTAGSPAARAAKNTTTSIPIVMATGGDPVGLGLVTLRQALDVAAGSSPPVRAGGPTPPLPSRSAGTGFGSTIATSRPSVCSPV